MPMYDYECPGCHALQVVYKRISELNVSEECDACGHPTMVRRISAPAVQGDYPPYECPITGKSVEGRRAHLENLKRHNCRLLEPGERESFNRAREHSDRQLFNEVGEEIASAIHTMPVRKRETLVAEVERGADATVIRQTLRP